MEFWNFRSWLFEPTTLGEAWRDIQWGHPEKDLQIVRDYNPHNPELQHLRIMVCGPTGSGKSSFINSVDTVLKGRLACQALADAPIGQTFTKEYRAYKIQKDSPGSFYPFLLSDTRGFENHADMGVKVEDIKLALKGHIKDGYQFDPGAAISEDDTNYRYNANPNLNDRVHVLVFVTSVLSLMADECLKKMRNVRLEARMLGIPQLAILTKIDEACPDVAKNKRNVYKSTYLKRKIMELHESLGIPLSCIFPVKNYNSEIDTNEDTDTLILSVLKHIIMHGEDFVNRL
ncbi:interferon-induced protein 44-like [Brachionichthys hirsutus]|uniref:interferon-induced protein 44-like n=1 Tax=Brachionichthys hirsutus TaxID=412623 RepID=UPI003604E0E7